MDGIYRDAGVGRFTNGVDVTEVWTFVNSHTPSGAIQGVGDGMLKTVGKEEIDNAKGYGRGLTEVGKLWLNMESEKR